MNAELFDLLHQDVYTDAAEYRDRVKRISDLLQNEEREKENLSDEELLEKVQETQSNFWEALGDLENALGIEIDGTQDFEQMTLEDIKELEFEE